jgi:HSP20 family protein
MSLLRLLGTSAPRNNLMFSLATPARSMSSELFRPFGSDWPASFFDRPFPGSDEKGWRPSVDVHRNDEAIIITADLPGIKEEDVKIVVKGGVLKISGQREESTERKSEDGTSVYTERHFGSFHRSFELPEAASPEDINAALKDGVLKVTIPTPAAVPATVEHKIPIAKL